MEVALPGVSDVSYASLDSASASLLSAYNRLSIIRRLFKRKLLISGTISISPMWALVVKIIYYLDFIVNFGKAGI